jgi:hypothetical protein
MTSPLWSLDRSMIAWSINGTGDNAISPVVLSFDGLSSTDPTSGVDVSVR